MAQSISPRGRLLCARNHPFYPKFCRIATAFVHQVAGRKRRRLLLLSARLAQSPSALRHKHTDGSHAKQRSAAFLAVKRGS